MELRISATRFALLSFLLIAALINSVASTTRGVERELEREREGERVQKRLDGEKEKERESAREREREREREIVWKTPKDLTDDFFSSNKKPLVMIIHKSWCAACTHLWSELKGGEGEGEAKERERERDELARLSQDFVMVNAADADEPMESKYAPDGGYIPRVLFLSPDGKVREDVKCSLNATPEYSYFYRSLSQVINSMENFRSNFISTKEDH